MKNPARWGQLRSRFETNQPRKLLALDGGGIRGIITLGVLAALEEQLRDSEAGGSADFVLCDYFDLIGGTSTGAIIAAGLARGMSVKEIADFYGRFGRTAFERRKLWNRWQTLYGEGGLAKTLKETFGDDTTLRPEHLRCLLVVVTRNATTDSAWPISSNPFAKYNDPERPDCNLNIPLWQLVRASTAAPVFFPPEVVEWDPGNPEKSFVFVDGGTTPYNNPAFLLFRMATEPAYRLGWPRERTSCCSSPSAPVRRPSSERPSPRPRATSLPTWGTCRASSSIGSLVDQDVNCRVVGRCTYGDEIDREMYDMVERDCGYETPREQFLKAPPIPLESNLGRAFLYARYNADLSRAGLDALGFNQLDSEKIQEMDNVKNINSLLAIGRAVGQKVRLEHFGAFV